MVYAWIGLCIVLGVFFLLWKTSRLHEWQRGFLPVLFLAAIPVLISVNSTLKAKMSHCFYEVPEILIFCMLGVFEACIRSRLMPRNENYAAFFSAMQIPAMITNAALSPVYRTAEALDAGPEQLRAAPAEARRRWRRAAAGSACCTGTRSR